MEPLREAATLRPTKLNPGSDLMKLVCSVLARGLSIDITASRVEYPRDILSFGGNGIFVHEVRSLVFDPVLSSVRIGKLGSNPPTKGLSSGAGVASTGVKCPSRLRAGLLKRASD